MMAWVRQYSSPNAVVVGARKLKALRITATLRFGPLFGGLGPLLGATYAVHLRLIGKLVGDFLLVIIELFR